MDQRILSNNDQYDELDKWLSDKRVLVVCGPGYRYINKAKDVVNLHKDIVYFDHYKPNPVYESVVEGVELFNKENCDAVMAVGGGSAIDVAKCIKLFCKMDIQKSFLDQPITDTRIPLMVVPTTAGTGSESTRYAVIYLNDEKQSITSDYCIPDTVLLDPNTLSSLPEYQRKSTMLDTLAHALESMWSINSTSESMRYSGKAIRLFKENMDGYLNNTYEGNAGMQKAAHIAGKAINITQTTAGHAMCYKITSLFGCAHGHSAMMCNRKLLPWMINHLDKCCDPRGERRVRDAFDYIAQELQCESIDQAAKWIEDIFDSFELVIPSPDEEQFSVLANSVNTIRLKNNPVSMDVDSIKELYQLVMNKVL